MPKPLPIPYWTWVEPQEEGDTGHWEANTNIPTPTEIRNRWCFGLPLTKEDGVAMPDEDIKQYIDSAITEVERRLGIFLKPTVIVSNPKERGIPEADYDREEPPYDYDVRAWRQYGFLQLRERPVQEVTGFNLVLPNGTIIMDFMTRPEWIKLDKVNGQINLVPYAGDPTLFALMGGSQSGYPFVTGMINSNLPHMIYMDYVAGYPLHRIPNDIRNVVAKIAAIDVLGVAGDAVMVGLSSISTSIDGLSESMSLTASAQFATYGAHINQFKKEVEEFFAKGSVRSSERGITFIGL